MVVPFGISIGDFIALGHLAHEIATALSDCRGAAADYMSLIELLWSLQTSVNLINDFISSPSFSAAVNVDQAFLNGLSFHASCCHRLLNQFKVDSRKYTDTLVNGRGNRAHMVFRKLKWSLYSSEDARKLEHRLTAHLEAFDRYLLAVDIQLGQQSAQRLENRVGHLSHALSEITKSVHTMQAELPRYLGYPWEGDAASSYIYLDDALGRITVLPAVLCRNFGTFHDTLKIMFSGHPGFEAVVRDEFEINDDTNGCSIFRGFTNTNIWLSALQDLAQASIKPGSKLSMNMLCVRTQDAPRDSLIPSIQILESCPHCGFRTSGRAFKKCLSCNLTFRKTVRECGEGMYLTPTIEPIIKRDGDRPEWTSKVILRRSTDQLPFTPPKRCGQIAINSAGTSIDPDLRSSDKVSERKFFRRVHHVTDYLVPTRIRKHTFGHSRLPLFQAIGQRDLLWIRDLLLHTDTDPDCRSSRGWTALQETCATRSGNPRAFIELLIANGADVNASPAYCYGRTALQAACESGKQEVVSILLKAGADINAIPAPYAGRSALAAASRAGHLGIVRMLVDRGADINQPACDRHGYTALSAAARLGHLEIVDHLVQSGAELRGNNGLEALRRAVLKDHRDVASRLLELGVVVNSDVTGCRPIHDSRSAEMSELLVTHGAQVDTLSLGEHGFTALQIASGAGNLSLVEALIRLGGDVHAPGHGIGGLTALQFAAVNVKLPMIELLVNKYGANVNEPRSLKDGYTSLERACGTTARRQQRDGLDIVGFLLEHGAETTPFTLHIAAASGHTPLAQLLLRYGASVEEPSNIEADGDVFDGKSWVKVMSGETATKTAHLNGHHDLAEILKKAVFPAED